MDKNSIKIVCDQTDCIHNDHDGVIVGVSGIVYNICTHLHPAIQRYGKHPNFDSLFCNSKERNMTDPNLDEYKGCSDGTCDPNRRSFTEYGDVDDKSPIPKSIIESDIIPKEEIDKGFDISGVGEIVHEQLKSKK